ncbi:hypothetical protein BO86DRAFT_197025 [Aspergillus japonicus CBS 114.51]|uniref:Uncharacterized protein n=1 Tax=Aspergillus japonicus CBS 114.51 TaxID=1448312 RepID=A0A8T8WR18_ASPJA|nr:hypothetical protein BO86DRAFT_197025 [Aspergillus japonicus CBS 114.51]RAH78100.1 hypothetical protein BO86DRAFT_197025 [Aspergillus japonicus CBS 114.51]
MGHCNYPAAAENTKAVEFYFSQIRMPHEDFVDGLWNGLLHHRDTLESLVIETGFPEWTDWLSSEKPEAYHPCAPLGEFPGQKELAFSEDCLHCETPCWHEDTGTWTTAAFPPNLETLTIMDCFRADEEELDFDSVLGRFVDEGQDASNRLRSQPGDLTKPSTSTRPNQLVWTKGFDSNSGITDLVALGFRKSAIPRLLSPILNSHSSQWRHRSRRF